jgi:ADP-ribose pyrophosphatase YjhB (NUDIX family)
MTTQAADHPSLAPRWLEWGREIQALAQSGLHYAENEYQRHRYTRLTEIAAEMISEHAGLEYPQVLQTLRAPAGYATPRVDVRSAVFQEGRLLLVREREDGGWTLPGGWADVGDIPSEAAEREVWEEAGFRVRATRVIGVYDANRVGPLELFHAFKLLFLCDLLGGQATPSIETSEVAFFGPDEIPATLSGERTRPRQILDAFAALIDPQLPTVFD